MSPRPVSKPLRFGDSIRNPTPSQGYSPSWSLPDGQQWPLGNLVDYVLPFEALLHTDEQPLFLAVDQDRLERERAPVSRSEMYEKSKTVPAYLDVTLIPTRCKGWVITGMACSRDDVQIRLRTNARYGWRTFGGPLLRSGMAFTNPVVVPQQIALYGAISMFPGIEPPGENAFVIFYGVCNEALA